MSVEFEKTVLQELKMINTKLDRHEERLNEHDKRFDGYSKTTLSSPSISLNSHIISSSI